MKKILSTMLAVVMLASTLFAMPFSASAATESIDYDIVNENMSYLHWLIETYGEYDEEDDDYYINDYDDFYTSDYSYAEVYTYIAAESDGSFEFNMNFYVDEEWINQCHMTVDSENYATIKFDFDGGDDWDLGIAQYLPDLYNHNTDYIDDVYDFDILTNYYDFDYNRILKISDDYFCTAMEAWDDLLWYEFDGNMSWVGFVKYCPHSMTTLSLTKASTTKDGRKIQECFDCGYVKDTTILKASSISLSTSSYTYDGKAKKPSVTVKDSKGNKISSSNYTVSYSNNTKIGTATVKVTFKNDRTGTLTKTYKINPKGTSLTSVSAGSKSFTAKWKKQATQTTGYQIRYSTKSDMSSAKTVTISKNTTLSKKVSSLSKKKKYYVQVRTYKTVSGTKYYSGWSSKKSVTTK